MAVTGDLWAQELAVSLKTWGKEKGYSQLYKLANELGIPMRVWRTISIGESISTDIEQYARIYLHTGLSKSDPRTIPPRVFVTPTGRTEKPRAWTEDQWQDWLKKKSNEQRSHIQVRPKTRPNRSRSKRIAEEGLVVSGAGVSSSVIDNAINSIAGVIAVKVGQQVVRDIKDYLHAISAARPVGKQKGRPSLQTSDAKGVGQFADRLHQALEPYINGSREERNALVEEHGRSLGRLLPILDAFVNPEKVREERLNQVREVEL